MKRFYKVQVFRSMLLIMALNCATEYICAQDTMKKKISLSFSDKSLEWVIQNLQSNHGIYFSYSKNIINLDKKVSGNYKEMNLEMVLDNLFENAGIAYVLKSGMVVLQPKPQNLGKVILSGNVRSMESGLPLEFAGVYLKNSGKGGITDRNGNFSFQVKRSELIDSLEVSTMGYEKASFVASGFTEESEHVVYLKLKPEKLQAVQVKARDFKLSRIGNHGLFSFGSIYIDTQGQQTALFIESKKGRHGIISSVSFYLSDKGNINSPFRLRIYDKDSINGKPGKDLLNDVLITKPEGDGWCKIKLSHLNIEVPENGFFVAIEGVYPNEFKKGVDENNTEFAEEIPNTISYGQRLGYTRRKGDNTWHYSLAHTWFQLKEDNFHVMISAEIQHRKKRKRD